MAIQAKQLVNVSIDKATDGTVTITGKEDKQNLFQSVTSIVAAPFGINDNDSYVNKSAQAQAAIGWGVGMFHLSDWLHARNGSAPISPLTGLFA